MPVKSTIRAPYTANVLTVKVLVAAGTLHHSCGDPRFPYTASAASLSSLVCVVHCWLRMPTAPAGQGQDVCGPSSPT